MNERNDTRIIVVFTGPIGAGRRAVAEMAAATLQLKRVASYTTRDKNPAEPEGSHHNITEEQFETAERAGEFLETIRHRGHRYGVKTDEIESTLQSGGSVYIVLNKDGAEKLKRLYGHIVKRVFIYADPVTIIERQKRRGDPDDAIARYMAHYEEEMAYRLDCEHAYENIDESHTVFDVTKALDAYMERGLVDLD